MKKLIVFLIFDILILTFVSCIQEEKTKEILKTDWCDEDPMGNVDFISYYSGPFNLYYLPGTAAGRDRVEILNKRNSALEIITTALDVEESRIIDIYMTPSRRAAVAHNVESGVSFRAEGRIEVLYLDAPDSYEKNQYGHEVTHVVAFHLDPNHYFHLKLIDEGIAEFFDQSGRNFHQGFVQECRAYERDLTDVLQLNEEDIYAYSYPKAASFIQNLFDIDPDPDKFRAFYNGCYMHWSGDRPLAPGGEILDAEKLEEIIDSQLRKHYSITLYQFNEMWLDELMPFLENEPLRPSQEDNNEIKYLFAVRDKALSEGNADLYRSTMEGFYCDRVSDKERMEQAERMTSFPSPVQCKVIEVFDMGIKNYPVAVVHYERKIKGENKILRAWVEHYPVGWRFDWVEDEYEAGSLTQQFFHRFLVFH